MTYVYVLVSGQNDFYYEQALMSLASLRMYMDSASVYVLTDDATYASLSGKRKAVFTYASTVLSIPFPPSVGKVERSRLIKTSIPDYIHDDFLYIDCDTVICSSLNEIASCPYEIAGVLDGHVMLSEHIHKNTFLARDKKLGFHGTQAANCNINGGVLFVKNTAYSKSFFHEWNEAWKYSAYTKKDFHDQSALNEANYRTGLKAHFLSGEWNCQPSHGGLAYLEHAKILHYYSSEMSGKNYIPYYKLAETKTMLDVRDCGNIPPSVSDMLADPKFQFNNVHLVSDQRIVSIMQSPLLFTLADIKTHAPLLFSFLEAQASFVRKTGKFLKHRK